MCGLGTLIGIIRFYFYPFPLNKQIVYLLGDDKRTAAAAVVVASVSIVSITNVVTVLPRTAALKGSGPVSLWFGPTAPSLLVTSGCQQNVNRSPWRRRLPGWSITERPENDISKSSLLPSPHCHLITLFWALPLVKTSTYSGDRNPLLRPLLASPKLRSGTRAAVPHIRRSKQRNRPASNLVDPNFVSGFSP